MIVIAAGVLTLILTAFLTIYFDRRFFRHLDRSAKRLPERACREQNSKGFAAFPVSVIICARNEARNLERHLPAVLAQDYRFDHATPAFEVVVVNDASGDDTAEVLDRLMQRYPVLRVVQVSDDEPRLLPGKKFALSKGLAAASHDVVVCTDADCRPASDHWLRCMSLPFREGKSIAAGFGAYDRNPGFLSWFIHYETLHTFILYYTFWKGGAPYMAVGRNLAALKSMFLAAQSHPKWAALPSGDDDLLIQLCASEANMAVVTDPVSFTWSEPKRTFGEYIAQKRRHVSTGKFYNRRSKNLLAAYALQRLLLLLVPLSITVLFWAVRRTYGNYGIIAGLKAFPIWAAFIICSVIMVAVSGRRFGLFGKTIRQRTTGPGWSGFFLCWILYNAVLAPWILWKTKQRWK